ncbi:MAG: 30S ribosomal protein S16 [Leptospiraceae bacterium]|nr:30S ribosomal protein S16 [Leptospiraceae bacterium]
MVKLRLQRTGTKNDPHYRIVAADSRFPRDGRFIQIVGQYHPTSKKNQVVLDSDLAKDWIKKGAQPTETVKSLLIQSGILEKTKRA